METLLAGLPGVARARDRHPLLVSTGYGRSLESAFAAAGEDVDVVRYVAAGGERGKFFIGARAGARR